MDMQSKANPPVARRIPVEHRLHGDVRHDDYAWLRQRDDPEVLAYLRAENDYTSRCLKRTAALKIRLVEEMRGRIEDILGTQLRGMWVGTFHSIAHRLLRSHWMEGPCIRQCKYD